MNVEQIYKDSQALLEGHFLLSSGNHSQFYLQSAKVLEYPKTAKAFRKNILSSGGSDDALKLYRQFRGKDAGIEPLLKSRGLID